MSAKNKDGQWYEIDRAVVGDNDQPMGELNGRKAVLRANVYDKEGNPLLMVVEVEMDGTPIHTLEQFRRVLTMQNLTPVLMVPPQVRFLRLKKLSDVETRRMLQENKSTDDKPPQMPPPAERRIIVP